MISAEKLQYLTSLKTFALEAIAASSGYKNEKYQTAEFLGLTNGGQFCYAITFVEDNETHKGKVFVSYNPSTGLVSLDY